MNGMGKEEETKEKKQEAETPGGRDLFEARKGSTLREGWVAVRKGLRIYLLPIVEAGTR